MKRTVGFHVPSGAYHHRIAVTLPSRGILAPICGRGSDALDARGRLAAKRVRHHSAAFPQVHDQSSLMPLSARCPIIEAFLG